MYQHISADEKDSCVLAALSIALDKGKEELTKELSAYGSDIRKETVWGKYLMEHGFHRVNIPQVPDRKRATLEKMASIALKKQIMICKCTEHIVAIRDNTFFDTMENNSLCVFWYYTKIKEA